MMGFDGILPGPKRASLKEYRHGAMKDNHENPRVWINAILL